jgi:hypothetical protein
MDMRRTCPRLQKFFGRVLVLAFVIPGASFAWIRVIGSQTTQPSENQIRQRISLLIQRTIQQATIRLKDGTYATTMPVVPSSSDIQEVKGYGDRAVGVLANYVNSKSAMEQHVAFRFLVAFQGDPAFTAIKDYAERSAFGGVRQEATIDLGSFPDGKVRSILERISTIDPSPDVRASAGRTLAHLQPAQGQQQK